LFFLSEKVTSNVKVVLTGDGADENLAGYLGLFAPFRSKYSRFRYILRIISCLLKPFTYLKQSKLRTLYLKLVDKSGSEAYDFSNAASYSSTLTFDILNRKYFHRALNTWRNNNRKLYYSKLRNQSDLRKKLFAISKTRLIDEMLKKVDRMTMAHSLEARVPFLDHKLVEFIIQLPDKFKIQYKNGILLNKFILRKTAERYLRPGIIYREKHGFNMPLDNWIIKDKELIRENLVNGFLVRNGIIDINKVDELLANHVSGKSNNMFAIINLFSFESWYLSYTSRIENFKIKI
jgi:asparagine synthase (glutamine-hydrolysing)